MITVGTRVRCAAGPNRAVPEHRYLHCKQLLLCCRSLSGLRTWPAPAGYSKLSRRLQTIGRRAKDSPTIYSGSFARVRRRPPAPILPRHQQRSGEEPMGVHCPAHRGLAASSDRHVGLTRARPGRAWVSKQRTARCRRRRRHPHSEVPVILEWASLGRHQNSPCKHGPE